MELNKEYVIQSEDIQEVMFKVGEFITLIEKFKTFNIHKDYNITIDKTQTVYNVKLIIKNEESNNNKGTL